MVGGTAGSISVFRISNRAVESRVYNQTLERYDAVPNQVPDNDWGNTNSSPAAPPYYFRVTVTLHPGCSNPSACN